MRYGLLVIGLATGMLVGCSEENTKPKAGRGVSRGNVPPVAAIGSPAGTEISKSFQETGGTVRLDAITLTAPTTWNRVQARSSFIQAEFGLSKAEGDSVEGRLTVSTAGGSVEANIERWKSQFSGTLASSQEERLDTAAGPVTVVDFAGEFNDQPGPFAPAVKRSGYRMIAAIISVNGELHFVKAVGPQKTIEAHAEEIKAFIRSVQRNG